MKKVNKKWVVLLAASLLALVVTVSLPAKAADYMTRDQAEKACPAALVKGTSLSPLEQEPKAICNCFVQLTAFIKKEDRKADFVIYKGTDDNLLRENIRYCIDKYNEDPANFLDLFGAYRGYK